MKPLPHAVGARKRFVQPSLIARPGTYDGHHRRMSIDFFGIPPTDARKHDVAVFAPIRMRPCALIRLGQSQR